MDKPKHKKRCLNFFTKEKWKDGLINKEWENLANTENLDEMTACLNKHITDALDECASMKTFKVREQHKFGITEKSAQFFKL